MSPEEMIKQTVKVEEAAMILGISRATAYQLAKEGKLPGALRLGRRIVVSKKSCGAFFGRLSGLNHSQQRTDREWRKTPHVHRTLKSTAQQTGSGNPLGSRGNDPLDAHKLERSD